MANNRQLILRSPVLDDVVKRHLKERMEPRRPGRNSLDNIGGMNFSTAGKLSHQFLIEDHSGSGSAVVSVVNGNAPASFSAGSLNGVEYARKDITFSSDGIYYIYAIDGNIYALKHRFYSDLVPALLLGVVTMSAGVLSIEQRSFEDNPTVDVLGAVNGAVTFTYKLNYANYTLTASYTASAKMAVNDTVIELSSTTIPANTNGKLTGYIESLTVPFNTSPVAGIVFGDATDNAEWTSVILNYKYDSGEFRVLSVMENPWNFTFSRFPLNAVEAGE